MCKRRRKGCHNGRGNVREILEVARREACEAAEAAERAEKEARDAVAAINCALDELDENGFDDRCCCGHNRSDRYVGNFSYNDFCRNTCWCSRNR